jgi:hypothetical protein
VGYQDRIPMPSVFPIGQKVNLPGHFSEDVTLEGVREIAGGFELRVRLADGSLEGLGRLSIAHHGPIKHVASALVLPTDGEAESEFMDLDPAANRKIQLAAEDIVIEYETSHGRECEGSVI